MITHRGAYWIIGHPERWFCFKRYRFGYTVFKIGRLWASWGWPETGGIDVFVQPRTGDHAA